MRSLCLSILLLLLSSACIFGNDYIVNETTDGPGTNQLRGAIAAAVAAGPGPHNITIAAGTYEITLGQISFGSNPITIHFIGAGSTSTIIHMNTTGQNRIFRINPTATVPDVHVSFQGITFQNGLVTTDNFGGGAIRCGGPNNTISITNCVFNANSINGVIAGTNGGAINMSGGGSLTIDQCTFFNNSTPDGDGGAIFYFLDSQSGLLQITNSVFNNNNATDLNSAGGAIGIHVLPLTGPTTSVITIQKNIFIANHANASGGAGGAISINNGIEPGNTAHINFNRFRGNSATNTATSAVEMKRADGNVDVTNNWWGCNGGPTSGTGCDRVATTGPSGAGVLLTGNWLQLRTSSSALAICSGNTSNTATITSDFLQNSAGAGIDAANLSALAGSSINFSSVLGNISGAQTNIQPNGTATATFTSNGTTGTATVNAVVDNVPSNDVLARTSITVNAPPVINNHPSSRTVCSGNEARFTVNASGTVLSYNWFRGATQLNDGPTINGSIIAGATTANLSIQNPGTADIGTNYNVKVTDHNGCPVISNFTQLMVAPLVLLNTSGSAFHTITATDFALNNASCERVALVQPSGISPVGGVVGSQLTIDNDQPFYNGQPYVKRFYNITPTANANTATATITLYFLQSEFDSYNAARPGTENDLPTGPFDVTGRENLRVTQYHGNGTTPGTHSGWMGAGPASVLINPGGGNVNWNSTSNWWEVTFPVTGFSGFFVTGLINSVLPVTLRQVTASKTNDGILIEWQVTNEVNFLHYEVETSHDGSSFHTLGIVPATNNSLYTYLHSNPVNGINYYRLKLVDIDGNFLYSRTVSCLSGDPGFSARVLKNPFAQNLVLQVEVKEDMVMQLQLADLAGRLLLQKTINLAKGSNVVTIPEVNRIAKGMYLLGINGGGIRQTIKVIKTE